jgi:hypothetical protein
LKDAEEPLKMDKFEGEEIIDISVNCKYCLALTDGLILKKWGRYLMDKSDPNLEINEIPEIEAFNMEEFKKLNS